MGRSEHGAPQHPLEGRAPAREHHELVVARLRAGIVDRGRQPVGQWPVGHAGVVERAQDVRIAIAQHVAQAGEHGVRVPHLWGATPVPLERFVRIVGERRAIPLEHGHVVALTRQRQCGAQSAHPGPDDHDPHVSSPAPSLAALAPTRPRHLALAPAGC